MNIRKAPAVGQKLWSLNIGNAAICRPQVLTQVEVVSVGRKYFETMVCNGGTTIRTKFRIDDWKEVSDFPCNRPCNRLYQVPSEWEDQQLVSEVCNLISDAFVYGRNNLDVSLYDLKCIRQILEKYVKPGK